MTEVTLKKKKLFTGCAYQKKNKQKKRKTTTLKYKSRTEHRKKLLPCLKGTNESET